jgi:hypothetical protein
VDDQISTVSTTSITSGSTNAAVNSTTFTVTASGNTELTVDDTNASFNGNVVVAGNLTVSGTATYLDVNNLSVEDSLILLSKNNSGGSDLDAGIMVERGSAGNNAAFYWNEGDDKFKAVTTTSTGTDTAITDSATATIVANVEGNLTGNVTGDVSGSSGSTTGNAATATALQTARSIAGQSFDGTGNITIASTDLSNTSAITLNTATQTLTNKTLTSPQINTQIDLLAQAQIRFQDAAGGQYVGFKAPATVASNIMWTLPDEDGTSGQVLSTDGAGTFSWADGGGGGSGASYPNSTISTMPGSNGDYDLSYNAAQTTQETPFEAGGTDAFGVNLGTVFDMMDPIGTSETLDLGAEEAYVGA